MKGYLSLVREEGDEVQFVPIETKMGIYRDPDHGHEVFLETPEGHQELGFRDPTISSRRSHGPPIMINSTETKLLVHNVDNSNPITVRSLQYELELNRGEQESITDDCIIELGYSTEVLLTVEQTDPDSEMIDASDIEGAGGNITVTAYVSLLCDHFRRAAQESKSETQRRAQQLLDTITGHPAEVQGFEDAKTALENELSEMERMQRGAEITPDDQFASEERVKRYEHLAYRFEDIYQRNN